MNFLRNCRIGVRLCGAFAAIVALTIASAVFSQVHLVRVKARADELVTEQAERSAMADRWRQNIVLNTSLSIILGTLADPDILASARAKFQAISDDTAKIKARFGQIETTQEGAELLGRLAELRSRYVSLRDTVSRPRDVDAPPDVLAERVASIKAFQKIGDEYSAIADNIVAYEQRRTQAAGADIQEAVRVTGMIGELCAIVSVIASVGLGLLSTRSIVNPIRTAQDAANRIASGDLTGRVEVIGADETAQLASSLVRMQDALRRIVCEIRSSTESIQVASSQVASGNQDLSARTEETAGSLQQAASSMERLAGTMRISANAASAANSLSVSASEIATRGGGAVSEAVATMDAINTSSKKIADIIGVIDGIAFQTNILALNAAVEAARAGEQGRGFAVVAGEVRTLAQRSAEAAREIKTLIVASVEKAETGARLVQGAGTTMQEVVAAVKRVGEVIAEVKTSSGEQAIGIEQLNAAVTQVDRMTQQNAALVEESAAAAESMREQAQSLSKVVEQFST